MPYMIEKTGETYCVHKQNDDKSAGEKMKCYDNEEAAKKYMAALYSAMQDEGKGLDLHYIKSLNLATIPDLAAKFTARNEIKHYAFIWGGKDIDAEHFTPETDFWDRIMGKSARPLTWDHAQDAQFNDMEPDPVIGKTVDWGNDEYGRWALSVLDTDKKYRKFVDEFIEQKALGYSSDSAPQYIQREQQGKGVWLKSWPWFAGALTAAPCEPRMKERSPEFLKSIGFVDPETLDRQAWEWQKARMQLVKSKIFLSK